MKILAYEVSQQEPINCLAKRDEEFMILQNLIETKRNYLLEKKKKLTHISKQNRFLDQVKNDYNKYYQYINKQKQDQITALNILNKYIDDLTYSGELSKHNIKDAKEEQRKILREIKTIKQGLDALVDGDKQQDNNLNEPEINIMNNHNNKYSQYK